MPFDRYQRQYENLVALRMGAVEVTNVANSTASVITHTTMVMRQQNREVITCWKTDIQLVREDGRWRRASARQVDERC